MPPPEEQKKSLSLPLDSFAFLPSLAPPVDFVILRGQRPGRLNGGAEASSEIAAFRPYLGINGRLHGLPVSVPGDLSSRFGPRGPAGEIVRCVGLETNDGAALHHRV